MARFQKARNFYGRARNFTRSRSYGKGKAWGGARGFGGQYGKMKVNLSLPFLAGFGIGAATDIDNNIPAVAKIGIACLPISGVPVIGQAKAFSQGLLLGDLVQNFTGFNLVKTNTGSSSGIWANTS